MSSLNCLPCAKRKVRCDRLQPSCSHCRRRRGDICQYPPSSSTGNNTQINKTQSERIEKLEKYIRSLGHDPDQVISTPKTSNNDISIDNSISSQKNLQTASSCAVPASSRHSEQARLVEHDEKTTYIEAPVWYSWSEARRPVTESIIYPLPSRDHLGFCNTLLDPMSTNDTATLHITRLSAQEIPELWNQYLSHVHPMTMLFFNWEKEPLLQKAANNPQALSKAEQAFTFAVYFITILSLSDEECRDVMGDTRSRRELLDDFQFSVENLLINAGFMASSDLLVLQAFLLYLLGMRERARPAAWFSLIGIAVRTAQRMGLHRDGSLLNLPPVQAEEKRRVWWQIQHMEIMISHILGCLSLTLYANWDTELPANLDDNDIHLGMKVLPPGRHGLTSMSHCLWRYQILYDQRASLYSDLPTRDYAWITSSQVSIAEKDAFIELTAKKLGEKFIQHCGLLHPLHLSVQIGIRSYILAMKRVIHQPAVTNAKISEMPKGERDDFLKNSIECLEYYILGETTPSIAQFRWYNEIHFQWSTFVYVIIEARHRATTSEASSLWTLIDKVCNAHPKLKDTLERSDHVAIGGLIMLAWQKRQEHLQKLHQQVVKPQCITKLEERLNFFPHVPKMSNPDLNENINDLMALDFDLIDWSAWEHNEYFQLLNKI